MLCCCHGQWALTPLLHILYILVSRTNKYPSLVSRTNKYPRHLSSPWPCVPISTQAVVATSAKLCQQSDRLSVTAAAATVLRV